MVTESVTGVLAIPAATLGGMKDALDSGGSPETENVTVPVSWPVMAASIRL